MLYVDLALFSNKLNLLEEYDEEKVREEEKAMEKLFYNVVCERNNIIQCEDLSIEDMFALLENTSNIIQGESPNQEAKQTIIKNISKKRRHIIRRLI